MSQIVKKFIGADQVGGTKIKLENNVFLRARNNADSADVNLFKITTSDTVATSAVDWAFGAAISATGAVSGSNLSGTNTGNVTLGAVGAAPSANGASLSGQVLTLQPFDDTHPGVVVASGGGTSNFLRADGTWAAPSASGFATVALDNLASTAVNVDILPGVDNTINLGSGAKRFQHGYIADLVDASDTAAFVVQGRQGFDNAGALAIDWASRIAYNSAAAAMLDWSTAGVLDAKTNLISNVIDPVSAQDAATKAYVDSVASTANFAKENLTLNGTDITNQYKDLAQVIKASSLDLVVNGVVQTEGTDYTVSLTGGAGGKTRITFAGDLATGGNAALVSGDILRFKYQY